MRQSQRQVVNVHIHTDKKKKKTRRVRRVPPRPNTRHIIPPTIQVIQERWFQPPFNPLPPPQVPQSSTGHTVVPEKTQTWGVSASVQTDPGHPFATVSTPAPAPAPPPPQPMEGVEFPQESRKRARNVPNTKAELVVALRDLGILGVTSLKIDELRNIYASENPETSASVEKRMRSLHGKLSTRGGKEPMEI